MCETAVYRGLVMDGYRGSWPAIGPWPAIGAWPATGANIYFTRMAR